MLLEWKQKKCFGRTPENLDAIRPLKDGVIADFTATKMMLKYFVDKACQRYVVARPRVVVCVPTGVTEVEERAVEEATLNAGAREAYLMEEPMAVIAESGLVGYIESVTSNTAKVVSILDAGNAVSARVTRTRDTVISKGSLSLAEKRQMRITNIPIGVSLIEGDKIETSGLGGIYPKGILIGKVRSFEQKSNPVENEAIIESYVDFDKLETVAVICVSQE